MTDVEGWHALEGTRVVLRPLAIDDASALARAAADGELWNLFFTSVPEPSQMAERVGWMLGEAAAGRMLPFAVCVDATPVGLTTLCHLDWENRRGEIGYTWYAGSHQGTGVNAEAKRLLLGLAFDELAFIAVELRTHWLNQRSRHAIERLGAKQDGVLRNHQIMRDGSVRDTVVYSITDAEWPAVRSLLDARIADQRASGS